MKVKTRSKTAIALSLLLGSILFACNYPGRAPPLVNAKTPQETEDVLMPANSRDNQADSSNDAIRDIAYKFDWHEIPPGGGINFDGTFVVCPSGNVLLDVAIYGDLGAGVILDEWGENWEEILLHPLTDEPSIVVHRTKVELEGTIIDPNCFCTIKQSIELEFEIDFKVRNAWVKDATARGREVQCNCPELGAAVPLIEFWFPRDILLDLVTIDLDKTACGSRD